MTTLNCSVGSCSYNSEQCCCKNGIMVEGKEAEDTRATCCGSFREKSGDSFTNSIQTPKNKIEVSCEAHNCVFNQESLCNADKIGIAGNNACHCEETECASFKSR